MGKLLLITKKPAGWIMIAIVILLLISGIILLANQNNHSTLLGFTAALKRQLGDVDDITEQEKLKWPEAVADQQRILQHDSEMIYIELADNQTLTEIVNDRLKQITDPFIDWVAPVHLYVKGNLVVLYCGRNAEILDSLTKLLGSELRHDAPFVE